MPPSVQIRGLQKEFILQCAKEGIRLDGREFFETRDIGIKFSFSNRGHAEITLGATRVLCFVTGEVVKPQLHQASEGSVSFNVDLSPMALGTLEHANVTSKAYQRGAQLSLLVESILRKTRALDTEALCVEGGSKVWSISVELRVVDDDGNVIDAVVLAALAGLLHFRRNKELEKRGVHSQNAERLPPSPLSIHHLPVVVTFCLLNDRETFVLDALKEEEDVALGQISIAVNQHGELCGVKKYGGLPMSSDTLRHVLSLGAAHAANVIERLTEALKAHDAQREARRKNIWDTYGGLDLTNSPESLSDDEPSTTTQQSAAVAEPVPPPPPESLTALVQNEGALLAEGESVEALRARLKKRRKKLLRARLRSQLQSVDEATLHLKPDVDPILVTSQQPTVLIEAPEALTSQQQQSQPSVSVIPSYGSQSSSPVNPLASSHPIVLDDDDDDDNTTHDFSAAVVKKRKKRKATKDRAA